jgi:flagellar hook-associated protein 3 FlgL
MTVGDALFARLAIRGFGNLAAEVGTMQSRIASGVNDPRASADPARATELSALRDVRARLDTREGLAKGAADRLALTDEALAGVSENIRQLKEITLRAANDTLSTEAQAALRSEAVMIRTSMLAIANSTDSAGRPLFAGTASAPAFEQTAAGVVYRGDDGATVARLGDRSRIATGLPGSQVFGAGPSGLFATIDDTIAALTEPMLSARQTVSAEGLARLDLARTRGPQEIEITLTGPAGSARVTLDMRLDAPNAALDAINAHSAATGITAVMEDNGKSIRLVAAGGIAITDQGGGDPRRPGLTMGGLLPDGTPNGIVTGLRPSQMTANALVARAEAGINHMALMRAEAGSLADAVDKTAQSIASQKLAVNQAVSGLQDLDVAATITRLQSLLLTQQASQQAFVKISGQSLFNYLR